MAKPDFDGAAAQLLTVAFMSPSAREQIAQVLEMTWLEGRSTGLRDARTILETTKAKERTP